MQHVQTQKKQQGQKRSFSFDKPLYDGDKYFDRLRIAIALFNPLNAMVPNDKILDYKQYLDDMRARERIERQEGREFKLTDQQIHVIRRAQIVTGASIHPDTGQLISWPFRMSSFLFMGLPLTVGLTMAPPTGFNTFFWQWLTQTYFAGLNFSNRNASNEESYVSSFMGFTAAAGSGIAIALLLRGMFGRFAGSYPGNQILFNTTTSFLALAGAGYVNSMVMRNQELKNGITLYDEHNIEVGMSKVAAKQAVMQTATTRILLAFEMVFVPGFIIGLLQKRYMMPQSGGLRSLSELAIISSVLLLGLPASIAAYHREGRIEPRQVERELRNYTLTDGKPPKYFYYNRGL
ncbi:mitochondrial tricarboxylate carrier family [Stylonychia lemnae]|uniref:Mitochondrial tricarboxylate carrier family n=1 Tax=Stylonychia lemnae TaxID=5949 RepID=A0A078B0D0_STYLE|nr:mitochondrial tricarboxylate carrier family [Stylonychia lemnae]|eukprot:CDW88110.1 mitochondrial tricarboxylate carrier family [Stylonychia lemnae]